MTTAPVTDVGILDLPRYAAVETQTDAHDACMVPAADDAHADRVSPQDPDTLDAYVAVLPDWNLGLDDDPVWMRPVTDYGFERIVGDDIQAGLDAARTADFDAATPTELDPTLIRYSAQDLVNVAFVNAYIKDRATLVDPDAWYGQDCVVVTPHRDGYAVLDGTHRVVSDRLAGRATHAYVVDA